MYLFAPFNKLFMLLLALLIFKDSSWGCHWWRGFSNPCPPSPVGQLNMGTLEVGGRVVLGRHLKNDMGDTWGISQCKKVKILSLFLFCFVFVFVFFNSFFNLRYILKNFLRFFAENFVWKCSKQLSGKSTWTNGLICLVSIYPSCLWHLIVQKSEIFAILCWPKQEL